MPTVSCSQCHTTFYVKPNRLLKGWGKYCSDACKHLGLKSGSLIPCVTCGKLAYKNKRDQTRSTSGKYFCGKSCQTVWRNSHLYTGSNHSNWKTGESSYRHRLQKANVDQICIKCGTSDARILAVHHKDKNRKNNRLSNLVWLCHNCHFLVHHYANEAEGFVLVPQH
jgi:hypothetical protein